MEILSLLLNFVLGTSLIGTLVFYRTKKRKEKAEATGAELLNQDSQLLIHRKSIEFLSSQLSEAYTEIDKLQDIVNAKRTEIVELIRQTKQFEVMLIEQEGEIKKLKYRSCDQRDCLLREEVVL